MDDKKRNQKNNNINMRRIFIVQSSQYDECWRMLDIEWREIWCRPFDDVWDCAQADGSTECFTLTDFIHEAFNIENCLRKDIN